MDNGSQKGRVGFLLVPKLLLGNEKESVGGASVPAAVATGFSLRSRGNIRHLN